MEAQSVLALSNVKPHSESIPLYFSYYNTARYTQKYVDEVWYTYVCGMRYPTQNVSQTASDNCYV